MDWKLNGGIIIIGSLLWQDYLDIEGDDIRKNWRDNHLDINNKISIKIPIRYGRKSKNGIMTMVFSNRMANKCGFGYLVPLKNEINNIDELLCEALSLSKAEGLNGEFMKDWGALTYILNDKNIDKNIKKEIIRLFQKRKKTILDINEYKVGRERSCITKSLKLNIKWVEPLISTDKQKIDEFHILLAIATKPINTIPDITEISSSIKNDIKRKYFINNVNNGIITHDDFNIVKQL